MDYVVKFTWDNEAGVWIAYIIKSYFRISVFWFVWWFLIWSEVRIIY